EQSTPATILGDADRLHQVLINVVTNAVKYNDNSNPEVRVDCRVSGRHYDIDISDNGPGIRDPEQIFEKFSRGRETSGRHGGAGLGLAISRRIVQRMKGELYVVDSDHHGTRFRVRLQLADVPPDAATSGQAAAGA
ncbi:MAG TPA: ATP-binding protein, partial [Arenicellales bacterium]|nr:ATP-binding protein [Arenicellales bacterium]